MEYKTTRSYTPKYRVLNCSVTVTAENQNGPIPYGAEGYYHTNYDLDLRTGVYSDLYELVLDVCNDLGVGFSPDCYYCEPGVVHLSFYCPTKDGGKVTEQQRREWKEGKRNLYHVTCWIQVNYEVFPEADVLEKALDVNSNEEDPVVFVAY